MGGLKLHKVEHGERRCIASSHALEILAQAKGSSDLAIGNGDLR